MSEIQDKALPGEYSEGQEVQLIIKKRTDLGFNAIVDQKHWGILYASEVFQDLKEDQEIKGYIKKIREDGKIDLTLYKTGHQGAEGVDQKILALLEKSGGFLPITDKIAPDYVYEKFGVSKKKYKIALGGLYKARKISIDEDGIRLLRPTTKK